MGLPWVRLDTQMPSNPKILYLVEDRKWRAAFNWAASLCYSGGHGTDGFLPKASLPFLHASPKEATILADVGLWLPAPGGWEINSWAEFQPTNEEMQQRRQRAKDAAMKRWHGDGNAS